MLKTRKTKIATAVLVATVLSAAMFGVYLVRDDNGAQVLWNGDEAYFFITVMTRGAYISWLRYPWVIATQSIGNVEIPRDGRTTLVVVRITSAGAERYVLKQGDPEPGASPSMFTPREGHIYANCPQLDGLCVWAGDHFEPARQEERESRDWLGSLRVPDFENQNGWSKHSFSADGYGGIDSNFTMEVGDKFKLSINALAARKNSRGAITIDKLYPGRPTTQVFKLEIRSERISRSEYRHIFLDPT
jgi:hypothetical protein